MSPEELDAIRKRAEMASTWASEGHRSCRSDRAALLAEVDRLKSALEKIEGLARNIADEAHEERV
jgi:hypothetical protein